MFFCTAAGSGMKNDVDIAEGRVLQLRYIYELSAEQRTRFVMKEIMQGIEL